MSATNHPFPKCGKGHDLTGEDSFLYDVSGNRRCRICVSEENRNKRSSKSVRGAFDGGMGR